jgi:cysteine-rich repeat protein
MRSAPRVLAAVPLVAALPFLALAVSCETKEATPAAATDARGPACGNGRVDSGEECDDGNASNDDACLVSCAAPARFVAGDPHVHSRGCLVAPTTPSRLVQMLAADGIDVGAALVWGDGFEPDSANFTGSDDPASGGGRILHYDLEVSAFAAGTTGHLVMLGLRDIGFSSDPFRSPKSGLSLPAWARAQDPRVAVGMAHGQFWPASGFPSPPVACCMPWELPVQVARGGVSFLITERRVDGPVIDPGTAQLWRALLNTGYKLAVLGGSDYPCIHREIGNSPRTDVVVDGPLTYDAWLAGVRAGRTVVTLDAAHRLNMRVNGQPLGSEVGARAGEVLLVSLESQSPEALGVDLLVNGAAATSVVLPAGRQVATVRLALPASAWLSARTLRAHTGATYVLVDGRPIRASAADACYLFRYAGHLGDLVRSRRIDIGEDLPAALDAYAAAGAEFERRFREAGGTTCF